VAIVVFSDLVESTALLARLGDDRMEEVRRAHVGDVRREVVAGGGRVVKTLGDGAMSTFESALGALRAAAGIQAAVERLDRTGGGIGIAARVGVSAGEPIADGEDLHGMAVVIASRLCAAAQTGEVLVQDVVASLVASREGFAFEGPRGYELKGVPVPVGAARLLWRELTAAPIDPAPPETPVHAPSDRSRVAVRLPPALAAFAEEPLIGRDREIEILRSATTPRPGSRAVLVLGEPGIGKTRHVAACAAEAHARGDLVVLARCPPEARIAFEPWVRAIGELCRGGDESWRAELAAVGGSELAALVPELAPYRSIATEAEAGALAAAEGGRFRLLRGVSTALGFAAAGSPLLVVLDDAHWCDPASAEALAHLLETAPDRLVVAITARDQEMGRRHPVAKVLSTLRRTGDLEEVRLDGLDAAGLAALVDERVGRAITPGLAARLTARTSGNPFFAAELVRDLDGRGLLKDGEALDSAPVPAAVADLVDERLGRLEPATEDLLGAAAAIGPRAPVALAARVAGLDGRGAEEAVMEALAERLIEDVPAPTPTIAFPHALVREALIGATEPAARGRLHLAIADALEEESATEAAEIARHRGLAAPLGGAEPAIVAYLRAASVAAAEHDHEQACRHLRVALSLLPEDDLGRQATLLLDLGEQELLSADLPRARRAFRAAGDAARAIDDAGILARAALGFAGGDIGFGYELDSDDDATVVLLREGLEALGEDDPRLSLRMVFRLAYSLIYSEDEAELALLVERAAGLDRSLGDAESKVLLTFVELIASLARGSDPLRVFDRTGELIELVGVAAECGREDLLFRVVQWSAFVHYAHRDVSACDAAVERMAEIAARLGNPRFAWEVDLGRGQRLIDRGEREAGEELIRRAGSGMRRLRPDIQMAVELLGLSLEEWLYDDDATSLRLGTEAVQMVAPRGFGNAFTVLTAALDGDLEVAGRRLTEVLGEGLELLRRPDIHVPPGVCALAYVAAEVGDRAAAEILREALEPLRPYLPQAAPWISFGNLPEWHIGRLELTLGDPVAAVAELRRAVAEADRLELEWIVGSTRVDLAAALHARAQEGDRAEATALLAEAESVPRREQRSLRDQIERVRAGLEGRAPVEDARRSGERRRPVRALASRGRRRALAGLARGLDDVELERRFADPRRQRALLRAMARGFQPVWSGGFAGVIAYELEPFAIPPPPDAPWRWALAVDSTGGHARLLEPAPLDAALTIHVGLAQWVRITAGLESPLAAMFAGLCNIEGDVLLAARLESMFGGA
jgi:class 3 adenylate cyclase